MPRGPWEYSNLARERNVQSVIQKSPIFQEVFVLLTGRKKTKFQGISWLTGTAEDAGSIRGPETKIPQAARQSRKKKIPIFYQFTISNKVDLPN